MKTLAPFPLSFPLPVVAALLTAVSLSACGPAAPPPPVVRQQQQQQYPAPPTMPARTTNQPGGSLFGGNQNAGGGASQKQRQTEFLNRIRQADPQFKTIDRAVLNEENELGLILDKSVDLDNIPKLMTAMLTQMAQEFPGQDLNVIAYTPPNPPNPPLKIGTGHFDAQTRKMSYTPTHP